MKDRKQIIKFLTILDEFLSEQDSSYIELWNWLQIEEEANHKYIPIWRKSKNQRIDFPKLEDLLNPYRKPQWYKDARWVVYFRKHRLKCTWFSSKRIFSLCLGIEWIWVEEIDYKTFFDKHVYFSLNLEDLVIFKCVSEQKKKYIYIPKILYHNDDTCFFE